MRNNKLISAMLTLMFLFSVIPAVSADETDNETVDSSETVVEDDSSETEVVDEEVEIMADPLGADIRLLQLERAISRRVMWGATIVEYIEEKDVDADVSELNRILDELELLIEEVQGVSREGTVEEITQQFVEIKNDAKDLVHEFKKLLPSYLDESDRVALKEKLKTVDRQVIRDLTKQILEAKRQYVAARVERVLGNMGVQDSEIVAKIESGELTVQQAKLQIATRFRALTPVQKKAVVAKVKNTVSERKEFKNEIKSQYAERRSNIAERRSNRLEKRSNLAEAKGFEERAERLEKRSDAAERRSDKWEARSDRLAKRGGQ